MYHVNEIFYSLQGEGVRAGTAAVFIRFAGCNLDCKDVPGKRSPGGFTCDTDFRRTTWRGSAEELVWRVLKLGAASKWIVFTGGEPGLQVDRELIESFKHVGMSLAIETNGTIALPDGIDWITVSPKVPFDEVKQRTAAEVKCLIAHGDPIPVPGIWSDFKLLSPIFRGMRPDPDALSWAIQLVAKNPQWRLSVQQHKLWGIS